MDGACSAGVWAASRGRVSRGGEMALGRPSPVLPRDRRASHRRHDKNQLPQRDCLS
uniref:Uncharacterized protein n=1 Tax=Edwardsiella tarda TaxID=636 RepID=A8YQR2_EDWTA|nr:hypothetical protein [Edwardsiella tarda]